MKIKRYFIQRLNRTGRAAGFWSFLAKRVSPEFGMNLRREALSAQFDLQTENPDDAYRIREIEF